MAPLPHHLNAALTVAGDMLDTPTLSTPLNMAVSTEWDNRPVATTWNTILPISTVWVGAIPTADVEYSRSVSILVARTEPEPSESDIEYVDESSSPFNGDGVDAGDKTSADETSIDDDNSGDWKIVGDDIGDETTDVTNTEDVIDKTSDNKDDGLQIVDDGNSDETTDDVDFELVDDANDPVQTVGTQASAETIASDLQTKYGNMPTSIDDCIDTDDEIVTYTDETGNAETVNCTALANMETWYLLPCDDKCQRDLKKVIPGAVIESGVAGGLLPTILNNRGLWGHNPATQTAVVEWLTTQLQQIRNRLSTEWFDWTSVRRTIDELLNHPPVDVPIEGDAFPPIDDDALPPTTESSESVTPADPEAIQNAELEVEEARNAFENVKHMTKNQDAIRSAEEHLAEKEEILRRLRENSPAEVPSENVEPQDPIQPHTYTEREIAAETRKLENALERVQRTYRNWRTVKENPSIPRREQMWHRDQWTKAKKELKAIRKHIRDARIPVDDPGAADTDIADSDTVESTKPINPEDVAKAQKKVDKLKEISDKDAQRLRTLDEEIRNTLHNRPDSSSPEAIEAYEKALQTLQDLKQTRLEHLAKLRKELRVAERALKKAKGELKVHFPDDPVTGEQPNPYDKPRHHWDGSDDFDGTSDAGDEPTDVNQTPDDDGGDDWKDVDENVDGDEPTVDEPTEVDDPNNVDGSNDRDEWHDVDQNTDGDTEIDEPTEPGPTEADEPSEVDEPTEVDEDPKSDESPDGDGSIEVDVPVPGDGAIIPPGVVPPPPPPVIPIPGIGDVTAPTKVIQKVAEGLKDAVKGLFDLRHSKKKDQKAIEKQEKKVEEAKKKLKEEQEKEAKRQEKKKHDKEEKEKEEKQAAEDKKKSKASSTTKHSATSTTSTSTSTTKTKAPEPTVHHKQHDAEITFHGKHSHKFELYGKDWARGKHDADELHANMESCGMKIKNWEFSYAADKPEIKSSDWSFYAKGELLRKTAADVRCLNKVIKEANGPANLISETEGVDKADESDKADTSDNAEVAAQIAFTDKQFTFYGKGFAKDKDSGNELKEKMAKCSEVKDWKFYTQKKDHDMQLKKQGWDFYAEGKVKKIKRKCLNEVIQGMGGPMEAIAEDAV